MPNFFATQKAEDFLRSRTTLIKKFPKIVAFMIYSKQNKKYSREETRYLIISLCAFTLFENYSKCRI